MKFSWKWLSDILKLEHINFKDTINQLTLAGFEIEDIERRYVDFNTEDYIINTNITANRQDINSLVGLAREISSILNLELPTIYKLPIINFLQPNRKKIHPLITDLCIDQIINIHNTKSPIWLIKYLNSYHINNKNLLQDTVEYIRIKWGYEISIIEHRINNKLKNYKYEKHIHKSKYSLDNDFIENTIECNQNSLYIKNYKLFQIIKNAKCQNWIIVICANYNNNNYNRNIKKNQNYSRHNVFNAYEETLSILKIYTKGIQCNSYRYYDPLDKPRSIIIKREYINKILGYTNLTEHYTLTNTKILRTLQQLYFKPFYNNKEKKFFTHIPLYRKLDIQRPIDIIEEISRIYGFNKFMNKLPNVSQKGSISKKITIVRKIRKILRNLGFHEVINYCLISHSPNDNNGIYINNPLFREQSMMRQNLHPQLINNIQNHNYTNKNYDLAIFEIGQTFVYKSTKKISHEECTNLSSLIACKNNVRHSWIDKPQNTNWLQAKGLIEDFFNKISVKIFWQKFCIKDNHYITSNLLNVINIQKTALIYTKDNSKAIGIFGELKHEQSLLGSSIYILEINLDLMIKNMIQLSNTNYIFKPYSLYPSVTRDICIQLTNREYIENIKKKICKYKNPLIESIKIFNEYTIKNEQALRYIGLRITYRSSVKTLSENDIRIINQELDEDLNRYLA